METLNLIKNDPWLEPFSDAINGRHQFAIKKEAELTKKGKTTLSEFLRSLLLLHRRYTRKQRISQAASFSSR